MKATLARACALAGAAVLTLAACGGADPSASPGMTPVGSETESGFTSTLPPAGSEENGAAEATEPGSDGSASAEPEATVSESAPSGASGSAPAESGPAESGPAESAPAEAGRSASGRGGDGQSAQGPIVEAVALDNPAGLYAEWEQVPAGDLADALAGRLAERGYTDVDVTCDGGLTPITDDSTGCTGTAQNAAGEERSLEWSVAGPADFGGQVKLLYQRTDRGAAPIDVSTDVRIEHARLGGESASADQYIAALQQELQQDAALGYTVTCDGPIQVGEAPVSCQVTSENEGEGLNGPARAIPVQDVNGWLSVVLQAETTW